MEQLEQEDKVRWIVQYLMGNSSEDETLNLKNWIEASEINKAYYRQVKNIWDITIGVKDTSVISTDKALNTVLSKLTEKKQKHNIFFYWQRVAAVLLIPVLLGSFLWIRSLTSGRTSGITYNEVFASFGTRSAIKLSDGSLVWLNSGSKLLYPDKFISKQREIYLTGEAYFEVKSDKSHPFIVKTPFMDVKATGTKFNVSAYRNEGKPQVALIEGKVTVATTSTSGKLAVTEMKSNQYLAFDTLSQTLSLTEKSDLYKFIAWKDGKMVFRNEPLSEVVKKISLYYNADIEIQGKELAGYSYRATFKEESLSEILRLLKLSSPIDFKEIERKPLSDGTFPKRKVIIFPAKGGVLKNNR